MLAHSIRVVVASTALGLAVAQSMGPHYVDASTISSPAKSYSLYVDPETEYGEGAAKYRLSRGAEVLWTKTFDCTLRDVVLGDDGTFAGRAEQRREDRSDVTRLMVVGPDGKPRYDATLLHDEGTMVDGPSFPFATGLFVDRDHDRVTFEILHERGIRDDGLEWRVVRLSSGEPISSCYPRNLVADHEPLVSLVATQPIRGAPLLLEHWVCRVDAPKTRGSETREDESLYGARFVVVDLDGDPVWQLDLPVDYTIEKNERAEDRLWWWIREHGALLATDAALRFELALYADAKRVKFEVRADATAPHGWSVSEVTRADYVWPIDPKVDPYARDAPKDLPRLELHVAGTIELGSARPSTSEIYSFDLDDRGRVGYVVTASDRSNHFLLCGSKGESFNDVKLALGAIQDLSDARATWIRGERWLIVANTLGEGDKERAWAWWLDASSGSLTAIDDFACAPIEKATGSFDGGFVALTRKSARFTQIVSVCAFDANAKLLWSDTEAYGNSESGLVSPEAVRVSPKGEIGVLDVTEHEIQRFDLRGKLLGAIQLDAALGRKPNYPSELGVDRNGNWVVYDFDGDPPVLLISREGRLTRSFEPHFAEGRIFQPKDGIHIAPDGSAWVTDGFAVERLNEQGAVDFVVGDAPDSNRLGAVERAFVDERGRILFADSRTHAVHVFEREGKKLFTCTPSTSDVPRDTTVCMLGVAGDGTIHVGLGDTFQSVCVRFASSGARVARDEASSARLFQPWTNRRWEVGAGEVNLVDEKSVVVATHRRAADDRWLDSMWHSRAVGPDGSLVVGSRGKLNLFAPNGDALTSLDEPGEAPFAEIAMSRTTIFLASGTEVWAVDRTKHSVRHANLAWIAGDGVALEPFWVEASSELWVVDSSALKVHRFTL